ncbi:MAG: sigma-70 family RNA polymerase sigma factor [Cytophagales bacterium]|nr:sigma-70 family RNA polymerase sigma factor [Cytophagales bacterium]
MNEIKLHKAKSSDTTLWNQLRLGDEEAFSSLFERYYSTLVNYGKTLMTGEDRVKDCVQDVFVNIWTYRYKLNEAIVVKAYLLSSVRKRIARLHHREHIFSNIKSIDSLEFLFDFSIEDRLIADETTAKKVEQLNKSINQLSDRQKEAIYLRYHQGLSVEQVAEVLNLNYQSTKNLLHRAILQLRKDFPISVLFLLLNFSLN